MKKLFLFLLLLCVIPLHAQVSVVVFPLQNKSDDQIVEWVSYSLPEVLFRKMSTLHSVQVWDPVFLYSADTTGWQLESDSLIMIHKNRWRWDVAIGGFYTVRDDSVWITLKAVLQKGKKNVFRKKKVAGTIDKQLYLCREMMFGLLSLINHKISQQDSVNLSKIETEDQKVYATYAIGYGYEMKDEVSNAISAYRRVEDLDGRFAPALYRMGMLYNKSRMKEEAQKYLEKAVSLESKSSIYTAAMAELHMYAKTPDKAMSYVESERNLLEKTSAGMKVIGMAYILNGEYQRAVSVLTRAIASGPTDLETDFILGRVYLSLGQFSTAADIFGRLIKYRPHYTRFYSFLGEAYREAGRLKESSDVLERAMELDPYNVPNLINLANTYFKLGWYQKAEQYLMRAQELNPDMGEILINLGVLYWHVNRRGKARKMFSRAVEKKINVTSALNNQANILFISGNLKKAIKLYKRADKSGRKSEVVLYNLALAYLSAGKIKKAIAYLDEVLLISPDRLDVLSTQARLARRLGNVEETEHYYRKILDLNPGHRGTYIRLMRLYESQKRFDEAIEIAEGYLNDFPQDITFRLKLLVLYRKRGWYEVALSEYQNMLGDKNLKNNAAVWLGIGQCQYDLMRFKGKLNYDEVIYTLKKAIELNPLDSEPDVIIGSIYMDYKKYRDLAMEHWNRALTKAVTSVERKRIKDTMAGKTP